MPPAPVPDPRRWWALTAIALAQLIAIVDGTIMNIALPSAQAALELSDSERRWVITAYAVSFGGLLLLGGKLVDLLGARRCLLIGLGGFAAASALGGAAGGAATLLLARGAQGAFAALMTPAALTLLARTFPTPAERARAFGIWGTIVGSGSGIGFLLGGFLTETAGWRWCMFVALPLALAAGAGLVWAARDERGLRADAPVSGARRTRLDVPGALLATAGFAALVYGLGQAADAGDGGWARASILVPLLGGATLLAAFAAVETRTADPLLPPRVLDDRRRLAAYLAALAWGTGVFAAFLLLTFQLQGPLGWSALETGLAFLPYTAAIMLVVRIARPLLARVPVRVLLTPGLLSIAAGLLVLDGLDPGDGYVTGVLPVFLLLGMGTALTLIPANHAATLGARRDTGVAGAGVAISQQLGAAIGSAAVATLAGATGAALLCAAAAAVFLLAGGRALVNAPSGDHTPVRGVAARRT